MPPRREDTLRALAVAVPGAGAIAAGAALWDGRASAASLAVATSVAFLGIRWALHRALARRRARQAARPSPLARLVQRYARHVQELDTEASVAAATEELLELGLGVKNVRLLVAPRTGGAWSLHDGAPLHGREAPNARLIAWLSELRRPFHQGTLADLAPDDLREPAAALLTAHGASVALPLVSRGEIVGVVTADDPAPARRRSAERRFLRSVADQAAAAVVYVGLKRRAIERVERAKDVELTAAVQEAFIPPRDPVELGGVRLSGACIPASRCGGDWWSFRPLPRGRALVVIGDATGHGISAAMITAAAKGCADVALERFGDEPDLAQLLDGLDGAIRRVGAGQFHMTLFATLLDPRAGVAHFANAGHNVPYVCRPRPGRRPELKVLPARGNPLGSGDGPVYELGERPIAPGDVLVWFTDGLVEAEVEGGAAFGDRRMQRRLRELAAAKPDPEAVRDGLLGSARPLGDDARPHDDMTVVVASLAAPVT